MISFVECSMAIQNVLMILLEICMILELILLLVRITCFSGKNRRGGCSFLMPAGRICIPKNACKTGILLTFYGECGTLFVSMN